MESFGAGRRPSEALSQLRREDAPPPGNGSRARSGRVQKRSGVFSLELMMGLPSMESKGPPTASGKSRLSPSNPPIRAWGAVLFALTLAEGVLGILSAGQGSTASRTLLVGHVAFGIGLVSLSVWVLAAARRSPSRPARFATAFTTGALAITAATGTVFLLTGFQQGGSIDRGFAILSLAGAVLMMIWGSPPAFSPPSLGHRITTPERVSPGP
jgi:hypothetical protein